MLIEVGFSRNKIDGTVTGRYEKAEINFVVHYVGKRYINPANTKKLDAYKMMDANISYNMKLSDINLMGKFEMMNLSDENIMITDGSPIPGRAFRLSVACSL